MWRVLRRGGRLVITVWDSLDQNPGYACLVDIARRRIDEAAGSSLSWPFALGEEGKLSEICLSAGVSDVAISGHCGRAKFPTLKDFVTTEIQSWVLADSVDEESIAAVVVDSSIKFEDYCDADGAVDIPMNAVLAMATKS